LVGWLVRRARIQEACERACAYVVALTSFSLALLRLFSRSAMASSYGYSTITFACTRRVRKSNI